MGENETVTIPDRCAAPPSLLLATWLFWVRAESIEANELAPRLTSPGLTSR